MYGLLHLGFYSNTPKMLRKMMIQENLEADKDLGYIDGTQIIWL